MTDIALSFDDFAGADVRLAGGDLVVDEGLESAVLVSLFTDRRASLEQLRPGDDTTDLRGWWGDVVPAAAGDETGSHLWLLQREKQEPAVLARAKQYAEAALQWMVDDKVASRIEVATEFVARGVMAITATIARPDGSRVRYRYDYEWAAQAAKRAG